MDFRFNALHSRKHDDEVQLCAGIWTEFRGDRGTKSKPIPGRTWSMAS
jgi:hypothetical protein